MGHGSAIQRDVERAMAHHRAREFAPAERMYRRVLDKDPGRIAAWHLLGALLLETARDREAAACLKQAVARFPQEGVLLANLGEAQRRTGDLEGAEASLRRALSLMPSLAEAHHTLGLILSEQGRFPAAIACYRQALLLKPGQLASHVGLARALYKSGMLDDARDVCARAIALDPTHGDAHAALATALRGQGRIPEALEAYRAALRCRPDDHATRSDFVYDQCFDPDQDSASILREARLWRDHCQPAKTLPRRRHSNAPDPDRRLRIGYTSPDFRDHCQSLFTIPLLENHDHDAFELFAYSWVRKPDAVTERIRPLVHQFRDVRGLNDAQLADAIARDGIDILVDLTMHMADNRMAVFAAKPAPVQVAWLAYPGTTGLDTMDYRITDVHLDPPGFDDSPVYSEETVRLPESFWCYDPRTLGPVPDVGPLPALDKGTVTFGCLNNFCKTNPAVFALWAQVVRAVPGSELLVLAQPGASRDRVRDAFASAEVDPNRVRFVGFQPRGGYLAEYQAVDICLDTFPYGGHTTSLDAFWMGVPVVTLVGSTVVGRAGLCYAENLGLPEVVATTADEYVAAAVALARDLPRLAELRGGLRRRMERSPLMDGPRFARHIESAFREMWRRWCATQRAG
jgi:predicted O-linked N-acetylglucosamine transferase (SPINDLY family)